jgi:hypothetical protein
MDKIDYDISPNFKPYLFDSIISQKLIELEKTPEAIIYFSQVCKELSDYAYWFFLSTLWVSYCGWSDLQLWKGLFSSERPKRKTSIMKPSEVMAFDTLPYNIMAYRAHRSGEKDWISYTLDRDIAKRFARERNVNKVALYKLRKPDILALFLRRGEQELIMLEPQRAVFAGWIDVLEDISRVII